MTRRRWFDVLQLALAAAIMLAVGWYYIVQRKHCPPPGEIVRPMSGGFACMMPVRP